VARALRERATKVLALVVPDPVNPFYAQLAHGMERRARRDGFGVLVTHTGCDPATERAQVSALMSRRADGVLFGGLSPGSQLHLRLLDEGVPVACAFAAGDDARLGVLDTDDAAGMAAVVDHLHGLGHRRVAFVGQGFEEIGAEVRRTAFVEAAAARGIAVVGRDTLGPDAPTALVAHNDTVAIEQLDSLQRNGVRVPDDVSVVGYDDIALAGHARIELTTVATDAESAGESAAEQLIQAVREHRHVQHRYAQPGRLVVRETTGPAARRRGRRHG
jgi:LacI family transcriptional regulator